jgi:hypothetical protein
VTQLHFGDATVHVLADSTVITFDDGSIIPGAPEDTDAYRATALRYGYGADTLQMCKDHELMHIALCHWLGIESPTMRLLRSDGDDRSKSLNRLEEAAVLAVQQFARAAGVDLVRCLAGERR